MRPHRPTLSNFFVIEGLDGSGKSSLIGYLKQRLPGARFDREPTHSPLGLQIRELIKMSAEPLQEVSLLFLFTADRWEHIFGREGVALKPMSQILFSDRYFFSTLAYQGSDPDAFAKASLMSQSFPLPEMLFYLDIEPEESMQRLGKRTEEAQHYENLEHLIRLKENYEKVLLHFQKEENLRIIRLDARLPSAQLADQIVKAIQTLNQERS